MLQFTQTRQHPYSKIFSLFQITATVLFLLGAAPLSFAVSSGEDKPGDTIPKVQIEIKDQKTRDSAKVKVEVKGSESPKKGKRAQKLEDAGTLAQELRERRESRKDRVYQAGRQIGGHLDRWSREAAKRLGNWFPAEAFSGITWLKLSVSLLLLLSAFAFERLVNLLIQGRIRQIPESERGKSWRGLVVEALAKPLSLFLWSYGVFIALSPLYVHFEDSDGTNVVYSMVSGACDFCGTFAIIWFLYALAVRLEHALARRAESSDSQFDRVLAPLVGRTLRTFVVLLGAIILVQNLTGLAVGPLLASLGLGGFAIALAAKDSVSNFFGTVTIFLDRPFSVDDRVVLDRYDGIVENVGYRSTRIRTLEGHLVSIPNERMIRSAVENIGRRPFIRWRADIGLRHDTPPDQVERAVEILQDLLDSHEGMNDTLPPRVYFEGLKNGCLNITVFAWYHPPEYWDYMAWVHKTSVAYLRKFAQEGIAIAIPSRQIYLAGSGVNTAQEAPFPAESS
jgi:MscS family membrane protein